jgi:hypothetical protein
MRLVVGSSTKLANVVGIVPKSARCVLNLSSLQFQTLASKNNTMQYFQSNSIAAFIQIVLDVGFFSVLASYLLLIPLPTPYGVKQLTRSVGVHSSEARVTQMKAISISSDQGFNL